jgi:hypothetical protein
MWRLRSPGRKLLFENVLTQQVQPSTPWALAVMPYLAFNFYPTVMVEKNGDAFCDHTAFAGYLVALGHALKMTQTTLPVYRENCFSVDFEEKPMFAGVKQGSLLGRNVPEVRHRIGSAAQARHPELLGFHQAGLDSHPQQPACLTALEAPFLAPLIPGFPLGPWGLQGLVDLGSNEF